MVHPNFAVKTVPNYSLGAAALMIGSAINYFGDRLLDAHLELFQGLAITFGPSALLDIFVVPFIAGLAVSWVYGKGGKWLSYFPPFFVRLIAYVHWATNTILPDGSALMPMGWWGFFVVLVIESSAFGGILGEIFIKRVYSRSQAARAAEQAQLDQSSDLPS